MKIIKDVFQELRDLADVAHVFTLEDAISDMLLDLEKFDDDLETTGV